MADAPQPPPQTKPENKPGTGSIAVTDYAVQKSKGGTSMTVNTTWYQPGQITLSSGAPGDKFCLNAPEKIRKEMDKCFQMASESVADAAERRRSSNPGLSNRSSSYLPQQN